MLAERGENDRSQQLPETPETPATSREAERGRSSPAAHSTSPRGSCGSRAVAGFPSRRAPASASLAKNESAHPKRPFEPDSSRGRRASITPPRESRPTPQRLGEDGQLPAPRPNSRSVSTRGRRTEREWLAGSSLEARHRPSSASAREATRLRYLKSANGCLQNRNLKLVVGSVHEVVAAHEDEQDVRGHVLPLNSMEREKPTCSEHASCRINDWRRRQLP